MKCPLLLIPGYTSSVTGEAEFAACRKADCEWYSPDYDSCAIWSMAHHLETLADVLGAINTKYQGEPDAPKG